MASFAESTSFGGGRTGLSLPKQPLKRFEPALHKFVKVALPTDLERLQRHRTNMEKYRRSKAWRDLDREQINAARTVQQLKANIREVDTTRQQIQPSDLPEFDRRVAPIKHDALEAVLAFRELQRHYSQKAKKTSNSLLNWTTGPEIAGGLEQDDDQEQQLQQQQQQQQQLITDEAAVASWDSLQEGLLELNDLIHDFSAIVHDHQSTIDSIADNIEHADINVEKATRELGKASKLKAAMFPVVGAVVGGLIGGPVGLAIGLKTGAVVAFGGGIAGFFGGKFFKDRRQEATDIELEKLSSGQGSESKKTQ